MRQEYRQEGCTVSTGEVGGGVQADLTMLKPLLLFGENGLNFLRHFLLFVNIPSPSFGKIVHPNA